METIVARMIAPVIIKVCLLMTNIRKINIPTLVGYAKYMRKSAEYFEDKGLCNGNECRK